MVQQEFLSVRDAAVILGVHQATIRRLIWRGELPAANISSPHRPIWRIRRDILLGWVSGRK
jgi:excisionase family DNA binding protein